MATGESQVVIHESPKQASPRSRSRSRSPPKTVEEPNIMMDVEVEEKKDLGTVQENTQDVAEEQEAHPTEVSPPEPQETIQEQPVPQAEPTITAQEEEKPEPIQPSEIAEEQPKPELDEKPHSPVNPTDTHEHKEPAELHPSPKKEAKEEKKAEAKATPRKGKKEEIKHEEPQLPATKAHKEEAKSPSRISTRAHKEETQSPTPAKTHKEEPASHGKKKEEPEESKENFTGPDGTKWKVDKINPRDDELTTVTCLLCDRTVKKKSIKTHVGTKLHKKNKE
ncbi:unnamed protein product [Blepharisma stoltei]|uniref:Uncharacterized protein n=1 Tax=Blepharisma stoltei TaxID=1481888 RepID=A0AAU9KC85_9CILI|nr:unnamed protein product [Blepharisma stoltei]